MATFLQTHTEPTTFTGFCSAIASTAFTKIASDGMSGISGLSTNQTTKVHQKLCHIYEFKGDDFSLGLPTCLSSIARFYWSNCLIHLQFTRLATFRI
ncbi:hypothetical protein GOP47_0030681, partial [Adiantum capillus-veneris]